MATTAEPVLDALPPHDTDLEAELIGACFWHHGVFGLASRYCTGDDFFIGNHQTIWKAIERQVDQGQAADIISIKDELLRMGLKDEDALSLARLAGDYRAGCVDFTNAEAQAKRIEALAVRRRMIQAGGRIADAAYDEGDATEAVRRGAVLFDQATLRRHRPGETTIAATTDAYYEALDKGETSWGLRTGLPRIDEAMHGLRPGEMTVLAARTAHGKSALAMQIARTVAGSGTPVAVLSLEMDAEALTERMIAAEAGVDARAIRNGDRIVEDGVQRIVEAIGALHGLPITFSVGQATTLSAVRQTVSRWVATGVAGFVVIDYLQLVGLGSKANGNRAYEVGAVAQGLRDLAQDAQVPILVLAQLNRSVEQRSDQRPVLADLRESGGVEQAADCVWLLHRPALFTGKAEDEGVAFCHLAKNRSGPLTTEPLIFDAPTTRFGLLDTHHQNP